MTYSELQIAIPVFDDWDTVSKLVPMVSNALSESGDQADILLINDGSRIAPPQSLPSWPSDGIRNVRILQLQHNLGHQRAICVGLCYLFANTECQNVLVMDADGEDSPEDIPRLLAAMPDEQQARIVFAERAKRSEGIVFTVFYTLYRWLYTTLVGQRIRVGNFSVMNRRCLESLCSAPELWNHFAATAFATRQRILTVKTHRGKRIAGRSKMNFTGLVTHGLSSLSVFIDKINTRLLLLSVAGAGIAILGITAAIILRITTGYAIPGWATSAVGILTVIFIQLITFMTTFSFLALFFRGFNPFIPLRDHTYFIRTVDEVKRES